MRKRATAASSGFALSAISNVSAASSLAALARAREAGGEALAGEALRVARETYEKEEVTSAQVQSATLYTNVLKWYAGTLNPAFNPNAFKHLEVTGKDGAPLASAPMIIDARSLPDDQREAVREALLALRAKQINQ